eukprot:GILJ01010850.1.p2 GENE.GILJ01010850.1~~GILJ01010850.1.p2  ORF type:complete len:142 (-),score=23.48 GILJ01010850.1:130-555(-)
MSNSLAQKKMVGVKEGLSRIGGVKVVVDQASTALSAVCAMVPKQAVTVVTGAVSGPSALIAGVHAYGFGTMGIVGASKAAAMMSASAIASGGGVSAGSTVAVLQSIGAAGLGFTGVGIAAAVGAVTAYGVYAVGTYIYSKL